MAKFGTDENGVPLVFLNGNWVPVTEAVGQRGRVTVDQALGERIDADQQALSFGAGLFDMLRGGPSDLGPGRDPGTGEPLPEIPSLVNDFIASQQEQNPSAFGAGEVGASVAGAVLGGGKAQSVLRAANVLQGATKTAAAGRIGTDVLSGAAGSAALGGDFVEEAVGDTLASAGLFGAGVVLGPMAKRVMQAIRNIRPASRRVETGDFPGSERQVSELQDEGFELTRSQASGNLAGLDLEESNRRRFFTRGLFDEIDQGNQEQLNRIVFGSIGEDLGVRKFIDNETMVAAGERITGRLDDLVNQVGNLDPDPQFIGTMSALITRGEGQEVGERSLTVLGNRVDRWKKKVEEGLPITAKDWDETRRTMVKAFQNATKPGSTTQNSLDADLILDQINEMDNLAIRGRLSQGGDSAQWIEDFKTDRENYRNWLVLADNPRVINNDGNVSPTGLNSALQKMYGRTFNLNDQSKINNAATGSLFNATKGLNTGRMVRRFGDSGTQRALQQDELIGQGQSIVNAIDQPGGLGSALAKGAVSAVGNIQPRFLQTPIDTGMDNFLQMILGAGGAGFIDQALEDERRE